MEGLLKAPVCSQVGEWVSTGSRMWEMVEEPAQDAWNVSKSAGKWRACGQTPQSRCPRAKPKQTNDRDTYLLGQCQIRSDINRAFVRKAAVLGRVDIQQIACFAGECDSAQTAGTLSLHQKGIVVLDKFPNQSRRHLSCCVD